MKKLIFTALALLLLNGCELGQMSRLDEAVDPSTLDQTLTDENSEPKASWLSVGSSFGDAASGSLSMSMFNTTPYVVFSDGNSGLRATVKYFNGTSWVTLGSAGFSANEAYDVAISVHNDGATATPYVVYRELISTFPLKFAPKVKYYNGSSWVDAGNISTLLGAEVPFDWHPEIAVYNDINDDAVPFIAAKGRVMSFNGTVWSYIGAAIPGATVYPKIAVYDDAGTPVPVVAFMDGTAGDHVSVVEFNDGTGLWEYIGVQGFSETADPLDKAGPPVLYLASNGTPYVFFVNRYNSATNKGTVLKYNGTAWVNVGSADFTAGNATHLSITVNETTGSVFVSYHDTSASNDGLTVKQNVGGTSPSWTTCGSTGGVSTGWANFTNIGILNVTSDVPVVTYEDNSLGALYSKKYQ